MEKLSDLKKIIFDLENCLLSFEVRKDEEKLDQLISDDFVEFGKSGKIYEKSDILKFLSKEEFKKITIKDFEVILVELMKLGCITNLIAKII